VAEAIITAMCAAAAGLDSLDVGMVSVSRGSKFSAALERAASRIPVGVVSFGAGSGVATSGVDGGAGVASGVHAVAGVAAGVAALRLRRVDITGVTGLQESFRRVVLVFVVERKLDWGFVTTKFRDLRTDESRVGVTDLVGSSGATVLITGASGATVLTGASGATILTDTGTTALHVVGVSREDFTMVWRVGFNAVSVEPVRRLGLQHANILTRKTRNVK